MSKDTVMTRNLDMMYYNVMKLNELEKYIAFTLKVYYKRENVLKSFVLEFLEDKSILFNGETVNQNYGTDVSFFSCDAFTMTFDLHDGSHITTDSVTYSVDKIEVTIQNHTASPSDLNGCIFNNASDSDDIYPTYMTRYYMDNVDDPIYGDLNIIDDRNFFENPIDQLADKAIRIYARSENNSTILLEFLPIPRSDLTSEKRELQCILYLVTCVNGNYIKNPISVPLVCDFDEFINWKEYYNNKDNSLLVYANKLTIKWRSVDSESVDAIWLFSNNIVTNRQFPLCLVTYRYLYSCLTSHNYIEKSNLHVTGPSYDRFYPVCVSIQDYNTEFRCSDLPINPKVSVDQKKSALESIGITPDMTYARKVPKDVLNKMKNNTAVYFLIRMKRVPGSPDATDATYFYLHVLLYMREGTKYIKSLYNDKVYTWDTFSKCFNVNFDKGTITESTEYNRKDLEEFLPYNTLYRNKSLIPVFLYNANYIVTFYSNRQHESQNNEFPEFNGYVKLSSLENVSFFNASFFTSLRIYAIMNEGSNNKILSDKYILENGIIKSIKINCNNGYFKCNLDTCTLVIESWYPHSKTLILKSGGNDYCVAVHSEISSFSTSVNNVNLGYNMGFTSNNSEWYIKDLYLYVSSAFNDTVSYFEKKGYKEGFNKNSKYLVFVMKVFVRPSYYLLVMEFFFDNNGFLKLYYAGSKKSNAFKETRYVTIKGYPRISTLDDKVSILMNGFDNVIGSNLVPFIRFTGDGSDGLCFNVNCTNFYYNRNVDRYSVCRVYQKN